MIKARVSKKVFVIYDTQSQYLITVEITNNNIRLVNEKNDGDFIFDCVDTPEVRDRWRTIGKLITKAMDLV